MHRHKIGIVLQARMGSTRLPGKVLRPFAGKPMIQWIIERLQTCRTPDMLILVTSTLDQDQPLVELVSTLGVEVFRGSEIDVLDRYYYCALEYDLKHIIRATGDNPFVDAEECDRLVDFYFTHQLDYATISTEPGIGYPLGVGVEIFKFSALKQSWQEGYALHHREHVNEYILENPDVFKQAKMPAPPEKRAPELSLTVDTLEQFMVAEAIYSDYLKQYPSQLVPIIWAIKALKTKNAREATKTISTDSSTKNYFYETEIVKEAQAFDHKILERVQYGHIPDLRRVAKCEWFYNNTWRHPEYVKLDIGELFTRILHSIQENKKEKTRSEVKILEVGCGPGYISLELARNGYNVVGIDISSQSIAVARHFADNDPWKQERGNLRYIVGNFLECSELPLNYFDIAVFIGSLHHFPDQVRVVNQVCSILQKDGLIIAHEPKRETMSKANASIMHLIRLLLSQANGYYQKSPIPSNQDELKSAISTIHHELTCTDEEGNPVQSVNDNASGFKEMYTALNNAFDELFFQEGFAIFPEFIGGLRFDEFTNIALAKYFKCMDNLLRHLGVLQPARFFYVGRKKL